MVPLLRALRALGGSGSIDEIYEKVVELEQIPEDVVSQSHDPEKSNQSEVGYRLAWARTYLKKYGLLENSTRGVWSLTPKAKAGEEVDPQEVVWTVNIVNPRGLGFTMAGDCSYLEMDGVNCTHVPSSITKRMAERMGVAMHVLSQSNYADLLVLLGLMRALPYGMKDVLNARGHWRPFLDHSAGTTFREWAELKSMPELTTVESTNSNLTIFLNFLPHEPYFMGKDCEPKASRLDVSLEDVQLRGYASLFALQHAVAARCALVLVADYLEWMKKAEVYDNTKIVIVSDHGIVGNVEDHSSRAKAGGTTKNVFVTSRSVLFVKEPHQHGHITISEEFMPNAEVPRIVCEAIGGCTNPYLGNKAIATNGRDKPFSVAVVPWQFSAQDRDALVIELEYIVLDGDPYDFSQWRTTSQD